MTGAGTQPASISRRSAAQTASSPDLPSSTTAPEVLLQRLASATAMQPVLPQNSSAEHATPQPPQCAMSRSRSTHSLPQHSVPGPQLGSSFPPQATPHANVPHTRPSAHSASSMQLRHSWLSGSQTPLAQSAHEPASGVPSAVSASRPRLPASTPRLPASPPRLPALPPESGDPSRSSSPASRHSARLALAAHAALDEASVEASSALEAEVFEVHPAVEPSPQTNSARLVPRIFRTLERTSAREPFHREVIDMSDAGSNKHAA